MSRLTNLTFRQHGVDHDIQGGGFALSHDQGANKDWTYKIPHARAGDVVILAVDTPAANPSMMIAAEMVPGDPQSADWETFYVADAGNISPIGNIARDGGYSALYAPELHKVPADVARPNHRWLVARATKDLTNTHLHLVRAG
jgi:hypothetical protein